MAQLAAPTGLAKAVEGAKRKGLDWLVTDTLSRADDTAGVVTTASDLVFVPVLPAVFDVRAIRPTLVEIYRARRMSGPACCATMKPDTVR